MHHAGANPVQIAPETALSLADPIARVDSSRRTRESIHKNRNHRRSSHVEHLPPALRRVAGARQLCMRLDCMCSRRTCRRKRQTLVAHHTRHNFHGSRSSNLPVGLRVLNRAQGRLSIRLEPSGQERAHIPHSPFHSRTSLLRADRQRQPEHLPVRASLQCVFLRFPFRPAFC